MISRLRLKLYRLAKSGLIRQESSNCWTTTRFLQQLLQHISETQIGRDECRRLENHKYSTLCLRTAIALSVRELFALFIPVVHTNSSLYFPCSRALIFHYLLFDELDAMVTQTTITIKSVADVFALENLLDNGWRNCKHSADPQKYPS